MNEVERIQDQLRRSFRGEAWHGPALAELLAGVDAERAEKRPLPKLHSIREIVGHLSTWTEVARRRLEGERSESVAPEEDWPPTSRRAGTWRDDLDRLEAGQERLLEAVGRFPEHRLDERIPEAPYSYYFLLHGIIQHQLYHAGQIALLAKAAAGSEPGAARATRGEAVEVAP